MTKELRKHHMIRTKLLHNNRSCRNKKKINTYKNQRNYCTHLLIKTKRCYNGNLNVSYICEHKMFLKTVKLLCTEKALSYYANEITLVEGKNVISDDEELTEISLAIFRYL